MFADLYSNLALTFNEWLSNSPTGGQYVVDLTLDYANRAQDSLWSEPPNGWALLTRSAQLTISSLVSTLPVGNGLLLRVYSDADNDKKPDRYYFKDGQLLEGFKFVPAFTKAGGHSTSIQFYQSPEEPVYCDYQVKLDPFTGSDTEYLFFPKNLMLGKMQYLRCADKGMLDEWKVLKTEYDKELKNFMSQHQNIVEFSGVNVHDAAGREIYIPRHNLRDGTGYGGRLVGSTNDRDIFRR